MLLYCIRHGETAANSGGKIQGQSDSPLSQRGFAQCRAVAERLWGAGIDAIHASPLGRAAASAACIADRLALDVIYDERLMEINAGVFQGLDWDEIARRFPAESAQWRTHDPDFCIPGGESRRDLMHRAAAGFAAIRQRDHARALVVAHGGSLAGALKSLLGIPAERNPFSLKNGSITLLAWEQDVKLLALNLTDHLPPDDGRGGEL